MSVRRVALPNRGCFACLALLTLLLSLAAYRATAQSGRSLYEQARAAYFETARDAALRSQRQSWERVLDAYREVLRQEPRHADAPAALYMLGKLHSRLYDDFRSTHDLDLALQAFQHLSQEYPQSRLADDALYRAGVIYLKEKRTPSLALAALNRLIEQYPQGDMRAEARALRETILQDHGQPNPASSSTAALPFISRITQWSNPRDTRVVIHADRELKFASQQLSNPDRLVFDLSPAYLAPELHERSISIDNGVLERVRSAQHDKEIVRVVLDLKNIDTYQVFSLHDPYRVVIDVQAQSPPAEAPAPPPRPTPPPIAGKRPPSDQRVDTRALKIIIDPGHGGKDSGAISQRGFAEKTVTLDIAKRLGWLLQQQRETGFQPVLTRSRDVFVPLEERTALANAENGNLFISIHANAAENSSLRGIETYFLNRASSERERRVAARENNTSLQRLSDLEFILNDLLLNSKLRGSSLLAKMVQDSLIGRLQDRYQEVRDLGVKRAPFYVLLGARMPSILVEAAFLTNPVEEQRLRSRAYRQIIADAIGKAVTVYAHRLKAGQPTDTPRRQHRTLDEFLADLDRHEN